MNAGHGVTTVVVTYNRVELLTTCLAALARQSRMPERIVLVDNASTDGTADFGQRWATADPAHRTYIRLAENTGGAGGFARGIAEGICDGQWLWLMDDDAEPEEHALAELIGAATTTSDIYGSLARHGDATAWTTTLLLPGGSRAADLVADVPDIAEVRNLPFLGFLIHAELVRRIGLPDEGYFIAGDDSEYCLRARAAGARILVNARSLIAHPPAMRGAIRVAGFSIVYLSLPPWKRYYDTRNRILTARRHAGARGLLAVLASTIVRLGVALVREKDRSAQAHATWGGLVDGILGRKGSRHQRWNAGA